jgi:hypothetical protein
VSREFYFHARYTFYGLCSQLVSLPYFSLFINLLAGKRQKNAALTRDMQFAGPKAMQASDIGSNGLVGAAAGGANQAIG